MAANMLRKDVQVPMLDLLQRSLSLSCFIASTGIDEVDEDLTSGNANVITMVLVII